MSTVLGMHSFIKVVCESSVYLENMLFLILHNFYGKTPPLPVRHILALQSQIQHTM